MSKQSSPKGGRSGSARGRRPKSRSAAVVSTIIGVVVIAVVVLQQLGVIDLDGDAAATGTQDSPEGSSASDVDQARERLEELRVEDEDDPPGYDRALFPHWDGNVEDNCTTRQVVLLRDGEGVETNDDCQPVEGSWYSPYDGETFDDAQDIDIDHMVALKEGWRSGAHAWSTEQRQRFANDLESTQLWAVSASTNRSKGDADPADWLPPLESSHCDYVVSWIEVKHVWDLSVDPDEDAALREVLEGC
ncbi:HNH endonuclease family protein [Nocardiopsis sp. MG754419]|uniref:HNH endonuclease family protein n=1 Tax=Nocardiopsis sp. MG754419 TaxID=2259865 RepID=UPI001BA954BC|nr:HNH endonuclease family protein [Nocardiopsis sp. MG754419]MBR8744584.1 HNH endonuclease [Nocardiopsis sp. MG754419]